MKKLNIISITLLVICITLVSCINKKGNISENVNHSLDKTSSLSSNDSQIAPNTQYIRVSYRGGTISSKGRTTYPICRVISSTSELAQYSEDFDKNSSWGTEYTNAIAKYSNKFFEDNFLVIVLLEESSGSNRHKVERVDRNGGIFISRLIPEIGTADMAAWNIIIELNNSFKSEQFRVGLHINNFGDCR